MVVNVGFFFVSFEDRVCGVWLERGKKNHTR